MKFHKSIITVCQLLTIIKIAKLLFAGTLPASEAYFYICTAKK